MIDINSLLQELSSPKKVVIIPHKNPDGDAIGASLALYQMLLKFNHKVSVISPNDYPDFLKWIPFSGQIKRFDCHHITRKNIGEAEFIFVLDFNSLDRVGNQMKQYLSLSKAKFVMIDHHQEPDDFATYMYSDINICSTCQMIYHFFEKLGWLDKIDSSIATCLYTGIMTDTGSFRFRSTTSTTHRVIADLIDKGVDNVEVHNQVYNSYSLGRIKLLGKTLLKLKVINVLKTAYITIYEKDKNQYNFKKGDTEGFVSYALALKDIVFAAMFIEDKEQGIIKISFRSKGNFSVNKFARNHFNGGGHINAAGGISKLNMDQTLVCFLNLLPEYKSEIEKTHQRAM